MTLFVSILATLFLISCSSDNNNKPSSFITSAELEGSHYVGSQDVSTCNESSGPPGVCNPGELFFISNNLVQYSFPGSDMVFQDEYVIAGNQILINAAIYNTIEKLNISENGQRLSSPELGDFILKEAKVDNEED